MKTIYYTIYVDEFMVKVISLYEIFDNKPIVFGIFDIPNEIDTLTGINDYLEDNGYGDEQYQFRKL